MAHEKLIVVMDPSEKRAFMEACQNRMMTASAVIRHLVRLQMDHWANNDPQIVDKIKTK